jgi:hypothetical protein
MWHLTMLPDPPPHRRMSPEIITAIQRTHRAGSAQHQKQRQIEFGQQIDLAS